MKGWNQPSTDKQPSSLQELLSPINTSIVGKQSHHDRDRENGFLASEELNEKICREREEESRRVAGVTWTCVCSPPPTAAADPPQRQPPSVLGRLYSSLICSVLIYPPVSLDLCLPPPALPLPLHTLSQILPLSCSLFLSYKLSLHLSPHLSISLIFLNLPAQSKVRITFSLSLIPLPHLPVSFSSLPSSSAPSRLTS